MQPFLATAAPFLLLLHFSVALSTYCSAPLFGNPEPADCDEAFLQMPYAQMTESNSNGDARSFRLFAEPQFLDPPFHSVVNRYDPHYITQLPKIYKYSK